MVILMWGEEGEDLMENRIYGTLSPYFFISTLPFFEKIIYLDVVFIPCFNP